MIQAAAEKGYAAATVADVVRAARVSRGTFYAEFASKEECFLEAYRYGIDVFVERIRAAVRAADGDWDDRMRLNLADGLASAATARPGVYVVFRDDLPEGESTYHALVDGCGAEDGDEIIEVRLGPRRGELLNQRWRLRTAA